MTHYSEDKGKPNLPDLTNALDALGASTLRAVHGDVSRLTSQPTIQSKLLNAALDPDPRALTRYVELLAKAQVPMDVLVDGFLPELVESLGEKWFADTLPWLDVSLGAGRVQNTVHRITSSKPVVFKPRAHVLLIVPEVEDHTLGAYVLSDQLHRQHLAVTLSIHENVVSLRETLDRTAYDAVGISAATLDTADYLQAVYDRIRFSDQDHGPIALGGDILTQKLGPRLRLPDFICSSAEMLLNEINLPWLEKQGTSLANGPENTNTQNKRGHDLER